MKRYISMFFLAVAAFLLQTTLFQKLKLANVSPNLLVALISAAGFMHGRCFGMYVGVVCGVLSDFMYGDIIGICIMIYAFIGYVNGSLHRLYFKDDMVIPMIALAASDFLYNILYYIFNFLLRGRLDLIAYIRILILPELVYTVLLGIIIYKVLHKLEEKMYPQADAMPPSGGQRE